VGIGRKKLLNILQARCEALGVKLVFETEADSDADYPDADLIIASDGINSRIRSKYAEVFQPDIVTRPNRFIWLGTKKLYDAFTFDVREDRARLVPGPHLQVRRQHHTFIVECPETCGGARAGPGRPPTSRSPSASAVRRNLQGHPLMSNARHLRGSAWLNFQRVKCEQWSHHNGRSHVVLMGDAVHTAHFAIGSGTKLALEDAIELTRSSRTLGDTRRAHPEVLARYQAVRASTCCACRTRPGTRWSGSRSAASATATS
jgi:anthraniloyl-CoA monooxygenase